MHRGFGAFGFGHGRGGGHGVGWHQHAFGAPPVGWGYPPYAPPTKEETLSALKSNAEWLEEQLQAVTKRIEELE